MAVISTRLRNALRIGLASPQAAKELESILDPAETTEAVAASAPVVPVVVTFTAAAPATYAAPTGLLTVANGGTPTVAELVAYCDELRGNIVSIQAILHAHGLTT